ncbi:MAG: oxidoreductase [Alkalinema sp. CACIAM 70d]|nr:MAG: oxidoreductase [Alkalinema sp. CACIAM 70d]
MKYRHIVITHPGDSSVLRMVEDERPDPQSGEVRVRILATGVAFTDIMMREGVYPGVPKIPYSPGYDIVGIVDGVGAGVSSGLLGHMVVALTIVGGYSESICIPEQDIVLVPFGVDPIDAVSVVLHYTTAYQMLHRIAYVNPGERILIHGAAGGVGTALLELGKLAGLELYGTASPSKHGTIAKLGGIPIDYHNEDFVARIRQLTGDGVDIVFDAVGGRNLTRSYKTLRSGGRLVSYGFLSAFAPHRHKNWTIATTLLRLAMLKLIPDRRKVFFYSIADCKAKHPDWYHEDLTTLLHWLAEGKIKPIIAKRLPLQEAAQAHELLEQSAVTGKVVLICR